MSRQYTTNLRCAACLAKVKPVLDADPAVTDWAVDLASPGKTLTVSGASRAHVDVLLNSVGYATTGETPVPPEPTTPAPDEKPASYYPLALIVGYVAAAALLFEASQSSFDAMRAMRHFMAGFFLVFSAFKLLDLHAFADSYQMYDVVAKRLPVYGFAYPFIELGLGAAYLANLAPVAVNAVTLAVMLVSLVGVVQSVLAGHKIRCACLGTGFNLPMSSVTIIEDATMAAMAAAMLVFASV